MKIIRNNVIPIKGFSAINIFGILFVRKNTILSDRLINHERIHTCQIREMLFVFFYIFYVIEWFVKLFRYGKESYFNISFEREAYSNETNLMYITDRKLFSWIKFLMI